MTPQDRACPRPRAATERRDPRRALRIEIALVNNMPLAAFSATTRQFSRLLAGAAEAAEAEIAIQIFVLPGTPDAAAKLKRPGVQAYSRAAFDAARFDGLIVTGCEPLLPNMRDEAYWPSLEELVAWAETDAIASLWSCLAAHAAVLSSHGVARRPLPKKQSGVYVFEKKANHWFTRGLPTAIVPHSRMNALREDDLVAAGFDILTSSSDAGVDAFVREANGRLAVYLQGHPEYDEKSLLLEFRRDLDRWSRGIRPTPPTAPENYLDPSEADRLTAAFAAAERGDFSLVTDWRHRTPALAAGDWRRWSNGLYERWLGFIAEEKRAREPVDAFKDGAFADR